MGCTCAPDRLYQHEHASHMLHHMCTGLIIPSHGIPQRCGLCYTAPPLPTPCSGSWKWKLEEGGEAQRLQLIPVGPQSGSPELKEPQILLTYLTTALRNIYVIQGL